MFYRAKNKLKRGVKTKLDLTKSRYNLLKRANDHVKEVPTIKFCYADINCCLKVKFNDENQKDIFFSSFDELQDIVDNLLYSVYCHSPCASSRYNFISVHLFIPVATAIVVFKSF